MTGSEAPPLLQPLGHTHGETPGDAYAHSVNATVSPPVTVPATAFVAPVDTLTAAPLAASVAAPLAASVAAPLAASSDAPSDTLTAAPIAAPVNTHIAGPVDPMGAAPVTAPVVAPNVPLGGTPLPTLATLPDQQYTGKAARQTGTALGARTAPLTPPPAAPQIPTPLSAYEEELLRAYSPTLAGTYERWKGEGEGMPLALAVMMRQWRIRGCPPNHGEARKNDRHETGAAGTDAKGTTQDYDNANSHSHGHSHDQPLDSPQNSSRDSFADTSNYTDSRDNSHGNSTQCGDAGNLMAGQGRRHPPAQSTAQVMDNTPEAQRQAQEAQQGQRGNITAKRIPHSTRSAVAPVTNTSPLLRESSPKAAKAEKTGKGDKGEKAAQMTLPGVSVPRTPGVTAPMSNYLARTSLFAPIRKGRRVMHDKQMLHSPEGIDVLYTGKQLDMADQDVYLSALRLAGGIKAGDRIVINRAAFLRMLGYKHNPGARDYKWLEESFYRISTGRVIIKAKHIEANLPLMGALLSDTRSGDYYFTIPRETYALWAKNLYSYIDLEKRHALERNVPLSKWLQSYAQSHAPGVHTISMDLLHLWCGYGGRLRDFRDSLTGALDELTRVGILATWSVQERGKGRQKKVMISWTRERTHRDDTPQPALGEDEARG